MKIVIATAVYYPQINGVAVFSHNLAVGLAKRGNEVLVLCPSQIGKSYEEDSEGVRVCYLKSIQAKVYPDQIHDVPSKRKLFYKNGFRVSVFPGSEIKRILNDFLPDVVHVQVSDPIGLSVVSYARQNGIPVVTTEHNQPEVLTDTLHLPKWIKKPTIRLLESYFRNRQSKSDFATMPTERAIKKLLSNGKEFPIPVAAVSNGVDLSRFKPGKASAEIYRKYQISQNVPIILYVGRVDPEKKVETVILAFKKVRNKFPKTEMVIVGDGVDRARLVKKYGDDTSIHFLGRVIGDDLYELYKIGTIFLTASEVETQGIVLIEAAATGLPLVAVDKGAVAEICRDGENGYLCKSGSIQGIADGVGKILFNDNLRKEFAEKSIKFAHEHDFEKTLDRFMNIYRYVVKKDS